MSAQRARARRPRTLAIDIGGSAIKATVLDARGRPVVTRMRVATPRPATPTAMLRVMARLAAALPEFDRVGAGFPGVVVHGVVRTAANLHPSWIGVDLDRRLERLTSRPSRVANDADVQGLAVVAGRGVELVITLGTGMGSALFLDGWLVPNLELGHHPFIKGRTYEELLGEHALQHVGKAKWNRRLRRAIEVLQETFNCRRLYLGGGNARLVRKPHPRGVSTVSNVAGLLGCIRLWADARAALDARRSSRR